MTLCSPSAEPIGDPQFPQDLLVLFVYPAFPAIAVRERRARLAAHTYESVESVAVYIHRRREWGFNAMKTIRKLTRNGNAITISFHPAMLNFLNWRPGGHLVMEVISHDEVRLRLPEVRDLNAPLETSTIDLTPPPEVKA